MFSDNFVIKNGVGDAGIVSIGTDQASSRSR